MPTLDMNCHSESSCPPAQPWSILSQFTKYWGESTRFIWLLDWMQSRSDITSLPANAQQLPQCPCSLILWIHSGHFSRLSNFTGNSSYVKYILFLLSVIFIAYFSSSTSYSLSPKYLFTNWFSSSPVIKSYSMCILLFSINFTSTNKYIINILFQLLL